MGKFKKLRSSAVTGLKIAVGSSAAILIAELMGLDNYTSAGIVTLLTLMTTKWESIRLSALRLITYIVSMVIGLVLFMFIDIDWVAYGIYIFFVVTLTYFVGWTATISVNAVMGTHMLVAESITESLIRNEFLIVFIGVLVALLLCLFHDYHHQKKSIVANMRYVEAGMQDFVRSLVVLFSEREVDPESRKKFDDLRTELEGFIDEAYSYQNNTFHSHPGYYIDYFEMRRNQCNLIAGLYDELVRHEVIPHGLEELTEYVESLADNIVEQYNPEDRIKSIEDFFERSRTKLDPPKDMDEFESRAMTYHILTIFEEFLMYKQNFILNLDERQIKEYRS